MHQWKIALLVVLCVGGVLRAERVVMKDGTVKEGVIENRTETELRLQLKSDGIRGSITIPLSQVARIEADPKPATQPVAARPTTKPGVAAAPATRPGNAATTGPAIAARPSRGFFGEMVARMAGQGDTDPSQLPPEQRDLWQKATQADTEGKRPETLQALQALEQSFRDPGGSQRLDGMSRMTREESFGEWMARVHWDVLEAKSKFGPWDLSDVREIERPALIRIVREKTPPAVEPLRSFFPPMNPKTNQPEPFKPAQLQGINTSNAIDIREKSMLASSLLLAQMKLEPTMPAQDRQVVAVTLTSVNRILSRARELEPAARAAEAKAARDAARAAAQSQAQSRTTGNPGAGR